MNSDRYMTGTRFSAFQFIYRTVHVPKVSTKAVPYPLFTLGIHLSVWGARAGAAATGCSATHLAQRHVIPYSASSRCRCAYG